jgi:hypothetical protein
MCAQIMRRILVDAARKRATGKHGGGFGRIELSEVPDLSVRKDRDLLVLNDALDERSPGTGGWREVGSSRKSVKPERPVFLLPAAIRKLRRCSRHRISRLLGIARKVD